MGRRSAVRSPLISCSTSLSCVQHHPRSSGIDSAARTSASNRSNRSSASEPDHMIEASHHVTEIVAVHADASPVTQARRPIEGGT